MTPPLKIAVLGAGAWGTALAIAFARRHQVRLWGREPEVMADMIAHRENTRFLPGYPLPPGITLEADFEQAVVGADVNLLATAVAGLRPTLARLRELTPHTPVIWICKGLEAGTAKLPHQVVTEELGLDFPCAALTGPSFADEVARNLPTAVTLASHSLKFSRKLAAALNAQRLRIYASDDLVGAEVGGAVKNVMAIAAGICDGMGFGLNARAALITRGLAEITRLGIALGGKRETFMGLAGMGDLLLTCTGDLSRNRRVGLALASGKTLEQTLLDLGHTAEGVNTAREVAALADKMGIEMPITQAVAGILFSGIPAGEAVSQLLSRDPTVE